MRSFLKPLVTAIPLMMLFAGAEVAAADGLFKQKNIGCDGDLKKIVGVPSDQSAQILYLVLSASADTQVKVNLGGDRLLQIYLAGNDSFQTGFPEVTGKPGQNILVGCSGNADLSVSLVYSLSAPL